MSVKQHLYHNDWLHTHNHTHSIFSVIYRRLKFDKITQKFLYIYIFNQSYSNIIQKVSISCKTVIMDQLYPMKLGWPRLLLQFALDSLAWCLGFLTWHFSNSTNNERKVSEKLPSNGVLVSEFQPQIRLHVLVGKIDTIQSNKHLQSVNKLNDNIIQCCSVVNSLIIGDKIGISNNLDYCSMCWLRRNNKHNDERQGASRCQWNKHWAHLANFWFGYSLWKA